MSVLSYYRLNPCVNNTYKSARCDSSHLDRSFDSSSSIFSHLRHLKGHLHIGRDNNKRTSTVPRCVFRTRVTFTLRNHRHSRWRRWRATHSLLTCRLRNNLILPQQGSHRRAGLIQRLWSTFQREDRIQIPPWQSKAAFCWLTFPVLGRVESKKHDVERSESNRVEKNKGWGGWWTDYD